jgi:GNAT superfamily N-acetyltransferase
MDVAVESLAADASVVDTVVAWHWAEWSADHADADLEAWRRGLRGRCTTAIPFTLVAYADAEPVGCVSVCHDDADPDHLDRGPWVSGLLVIRRARNLGVGRTLLGAAGERARRHGATELWLHTSEAAQFYERCGYELVRARTDLQAAAVLRTRL